MDLIETVAFGNHIKIPIPKIRSNRISLRLETGEPFFFSARTYQKIQTRLNKNSMRIAP